MLGREKTIRSVFLGLSAGLSLGALNSYPGDDPGEVFNSQWATGEAHFAVECPEGGQPGIMEVAESGALPIDSVSGRAAQAVVRIACLGGTEESTPSVVQDDNDGTCLGYDPKQHHLTVRAEQTGVAQEPQFFTRDFDPITEVGVIGVEPADNWVTITEAGLHQHDLNDPFWQEQFKADNC